MIVVEGPDGAGKTMLCEWICRQFNLEMGERSTKNRDEIYKTTREDTWNALGYELHCTMPPFVWDRMGPYSDPICSSRGIPTKRECAFTPGEVQSFHNWLMHPAFGCLILCLPPLNVVLENVGKKHQLEGVAQQTRQIYRDYQKMFGNDVFIYNYMTSNSESRVSILISQHLNRRRERERLARDL